jgi:hypothetical protein
MSLVGNLRKSTYEPLVRMTGAARIGASAAASICETFHVICETFYAEVAAGVSESAPASGRPRV